MRRLYQPKLGKYEHISEEYILFHVKFLTKLGSDLNVLREEHELY